MKLNQFNRVEIGGFPQFTTDVATYLKCLKTARVTQHPGRRLVMKLLPLIFSEYELSTQNATGKTKGLSHYGKLDSEKMASLFKQAKMQFPKFDDIPGSIESINIICKKYRQKSKQWSDAGIWMTQK